MRSGGKWDVGSGTRPTQTNLLEKKIQKITYKQAKPDSNALKGSMGFSSILFHRGQM
jgi:hypothetical protein